MVEIYKIKIMNKNEINEINNDLNISSYECFWTLSSIVFSKSRKQISHPDVSG